MAKPANLLKQGKLLLINFYQHSRIRITMP